MKIVEASERLTVLNFPAPSGRFKPTDHPIHEIPDYTFHECSACGQWVRLGVRDFYDAISPSTSFSPEDDACATELYGGPPGLAQSFLDWYCPKCGKATRIYYSYGFDGKVMLYGF